jgi:hypothetical protein
VARALSDVRAHRDRTAAEGCVQRQHDPRRGRDARRAGPPDLGATGVSLFYAISVALFVGTTPWVVTTLTHAGIGHRLWIYVAAICAVSFAVYAVMPESHRKMLN